MAQKSAKGYSAQDIEVLEGLAPVQKRPGMYTNTTSPLHILQEVVDNCVDEALAGHASEVVVQEYEDGSISVLDDGRGMPVDIHPKHKKPGVEIILSKLHSGAKFTSGAYKFSGGLHGVGVSVVNALSLFLEATIYRQGYEYKLRFEDGVLVQPLKKKKNKTSQQKGTLIHFLPNPKYFERKISFEQVKKILQTKALLCAGLKISLAQCDSDPVLWHYPQGLREYFSEQLTGNLVLEKPWSLEIQETDLQLSCHIQWSDVERLNASYVNLIPTTQGGTHTQAMRQGLLDALREYLKIQGQEGKEKVAQEDLICGLNFILSLKMNEPNFIGQTKEKLSAPEIQAPVLMRVKNAFLAWLLKHRAQAHLLKKFVDENKAKRLAHQKIIEIKKYTVSKFPSKLADCSSKNFLDREIFLVEGDSAGSSAKQARDKKTQAILPLRGKILNSWEVKSHKILESQEVRDIVTTLGITPQNGDMSNLRYNRVCLLADADSDGSHIMTLLCALFYAHFPDLIKAGHLFIAQPPLYRIDVGKNHFYAQNHEEKDKYLKKFENKNPVVIRFKGLGEMNPSQLRETTLAHATRSLVKLYPDQQSHETLDMLMGKKRAQDRKKWLEIPQMTLGGEHV